MCVCSFCLPFEHAETTLVEFGVHLNDNPMTAFIHPSKNMTDIVIVITVTEIEEFS